MKERYGLMVTWCVCMYFLHVCVCVSDSCPLSLLHTIAHLLLTFSHSLTLSLSLVFSLLLFPSGTPQCFLSLSLSPRLPIVLNETPLKIW